MRICRNPTHALDLFGLSLALLCSTPLAARAAQASTRLSEASTLPVAISVGAGAALLAATGELVVVSVEASAEGTQWVLAQASDGARISLRFGGQAAGAASLALGTTLTRVSLSSGQLLIAAGRAIAFIPNEVGRALMYHEQLGS